MGQYWGSLRRSGRAGRRGHPAGSTATFLLVDLLENRKKTIGNGFAQGFVVDPPQMRADPIFLAGASLFGRCRWAPVRRGITFVVHHIPSPGAVVPGASSFCLGLLTWNDSPL